MPHVTVQTVALLVVAMGFFSLILARTWPRMGKRRNVPLGAALKAARAKIEAAKTDAEKADALCQAADACALAFGRSEAAAAYYLRAMRLVPDSPEIVERAVKGLEHRPRTLESLLWRKLGGDRIPGRPAMLTALRALANLYGMRPRHHVRAHAIEGILAALEVK
ncbi:MAG TPA: hypothetical protein VGH28_06825 [Polyangiaceae bacterium]